MAAIGAIFSLASPRPQISFASDRATGPSQIMWKNDRPIFDGHPAITHAQSKVIGFRSGEENPTEVTPMDEKWRVSHVELLEGGLLFGLVLYDEKGRPCVSFGYSGRAKADLGRNHVAAALKDAEQVLGR
jgi:hypothetical protein